MDVTRTPDERFANLRDFPFEPHYTQVGGDVRMHYVDEGPPDGSVVLMLHGEPTWSYLYRHMIPVFTDAGYRALAPDLVGFGRSDKPTSLSDYTYQRHVDWVTDWMNALDLTDITLFCQDWGSLIGLRIAAENPDRFSRLVIANGFLPIADRPAPIAFRAWRAFARWSPLFPIGRIVDTGSLRRLSKDERAAYDAPFHSRESTAGARAFPRLVPTDPENPAVPANRAAWDVLGGWTKPVLTLFGAQDPILGKGDGPLQEHIPGTKGQPHDRLRAGHFIQEDQGPELARRMVEWMGAA
ncbi:MAG TPA: haloalkane dehalogenase [Aeromicrobium sp.]|nr:haloalkane dehalogenase [Aeromicrobium sp.]